MSAPRVRPVGDAALSLEWSEGPVDERNARVRATDAALRGRPFEGFVETIPAQSTLLVLFEPGSCSMAEATQALLGIGTTPPPAPAGTLHVVPVVYGGDAAPDLEEVARHTGLSIEDVIARHASVEYTAAMLGFLPGFAYLAGLPEALAMPRRATPRTRVPAGAVAVAGRQTAIYPAASAGGWNLIGRTALRLFDPHASPPCLIAPGDRVRFTAVATLAEPVAAAAPAPATQAAALEVVSQGLLTTVQDAGRSGHRRSGVAAAGAADRGALAAANRAVGNPRGAAALECTIVGPRLRVLAELRLAVAGADLGARLDEAPLPPGQAVHARPGSVLSFAGRRDGCRAYVAFGGGIDVPVVLGSRATDLLAGFGGHLGRALRKGDRLALGDSHEAPAGSAAGSRPADMVTVRVVPGPQDDAFLPDAWDTLVSTSWLVTPDSDRAGLRLAGPALRHRAGAEIASEGMLPGCIQVPADGRPIVVLWDGPTTGGYAKLATVVSGDLDRLAQLLPGVGRVRFERAG